METLIILLFSLAIILLALSFFTKDKTAKLEKEMEQMTLTYMQDMYQLKKKVKILEEEFMIPDEQPPYSAEQISDSWDEPVHEILKSQVLSLYKQGLSIDQISKQSSLTKEQTLSVIEQYRIRRDQHE